MVASVPDEVVPPHARRSAPHPQTPQERDRGSSARAEVGPGGAATSALTSRFLRTRGGRPATSSGRRAFRAVPPHARRSAPLPSATASTWSGSSARAEVGPETQRKDGNRSRFLRDEKTGVVNDGPTSARAEEPTSNATWSRAGRADLRACGGTVERRASRGSAQGRPPRVRRNLRHGEVPGGGEGPTSARAEEPRRLAEGFRGERADLRACGGTLLSPG